jgi:hypothetical protein
MVPVQDDVAPDACGSTGILACLLVATPGDQALLVPHARFESEPAKARNQPGLGAYRAGVFPFGTAILRSALGFFELHHPERLHQASAARPRRAIVNRLVDPSVACQRRLSPGAKQLLARGIGEAGEGEPSFIGYSA